MSWVKPAKVALRFLRGLLAAADAAPAHRKSDGIEEVEVEVAGEGHVPALPVLDDVGGLVGRVEVDGEGDGEHAREAERHVGVAGEVEVELDGVGEHADPGGLCAEAMRRE